LSGREELVRQRRIKISFFCQEEKSWLDARGNKEGVNTQFSLEKEMLAFPARSELGEVDGEEVYDEPSMNVIIALEKSSTAEELENNLPVEI